MIRALIVDDEPPARRKIRRLLGADPEIEIAGEAASGAEALRVIHEKDPDLVYLDVQMPGITGFEVLEQAAARKFVVIFITAHEEFALKAFEAEALDYLTKPVDPERFERTLARAKDQVRLKEAVDLPARLKRALAQIADEPKYLRRLLVQEQGRSFFIPAENLEWLEAARNYVCIHANGATHVIRSTLEEIARQLDPARFLRINRSQVVNLDRIQEMRPWFHGEQVVVLRDGTELRWSRRFRTHSSLV